MRRRFITAIMLTFILAATSINGFGQANGIIKGVVTYETDRTPIHNATLRIVQLKRTVQTDENGAYEFTNVPDGTYTIIAHMEGFPDLSQTVTVASGAIAALDFQLRLAGYREEVNVTASGTEQSTFDSFQAVNTLDAVRLVEESAPAIGEVLDKEPGIAKRSFGPGSSRPVIRGFDGDRVLVLSDGMRVGALGSQSGDHGEPIDVLSLERLEVVKGPATLLYGSNAIGGVVNAVSGRDEETHEGLRGYFSTLAGTANGQAGISGGLDFGYRNWLFWGNGSGQRVGDYETPIGRIPNSKSRVSSSAGGFSYNGSKGFFSARYGYDNTRYGIPFASMFEPDGEDAATSRRFGGAPVEEELEQIDVAMRRHDVRLSGGFRNAESFISGFRMTVDYSDYQHKELEGQTVGTIFDNNLVSYRGMFDQRKRGRLTGRFGFEGLHRNYETVGAEALVQGPVIQNGFSIFGLEELDFERVKFQFGGRIENNRYNPADTNLPDRSFTGFSGAAGIRIGLWTGGAFVTNYTHSDRAPALEELYNFGPHIGNLTFEIGNNSLRRERSDGLDFSLRHQSKRFRAEGNVYYYNIKDFVFLAPIGEVEDGLLVAEYQQANSRFAGAEVEVDLGVHPNLWINLGMDAVDAQLKESGTPLPRIPPLRARIGLDAEYKGFSLRPEAIFVKDQDDIFPTETRTAGYTVFNFLGSYTIARPHAAHIFSINAFNLGDRLYRNHLSFIKDLAPEIGRGVRVTYTVRFF